MRRRAFVTSTGAGAMGFLRGGRKNRFPVSDHCDGAHFFNPNLNAPAGRGFGDVLKWAANRKPSPWPKQVVDPPYPFPSDVPKSAVAVTFIGHASFLLRLGGLTILTDPVYSEHAGPFGRLGPRRVRSPGLAFDALPPIDLMLQSHNHYDHLDKSTLGRIAERGVRGVVTPLGNRGYLPESLSTRTQEGDWWKTLTGPDGARVTIVPAQHFSARTPFDRNRALWAGFVVQHAGLTVYFCGDSGYGSHFREIGTRFPYIDVALLPIGAYEPRWFMAPMHVDPEEAAQAHVDTGARQSIAMHYGTFQLTDEAIDEPVERLRAELARRALPAASFEVLGCGETRSYGRSQP